MTVTEIFLNQLGCVNYFKINLSHKSLNDRRHYINVLPARICGGRGNGEDFEWFIDIFCNKSNVSYYKILKKCSTFLTIVTNLVIADVELEKRFWQINTPIGIFNN